MAQSSPIDVLARRLKGRVASGDLESLRDVLAHLPDSRKKRGVRYRYADLLLILALGTICGQATIVAIWQWADGIGRRQLTRIGVNVPSRVTLTRAAWAVDGDKLDAALGAWLARQVIAPGQPLIVAVDGKELRGAKHGGGARVHLLSVVQQVTGIVLGQVSVGVKTNEIPMFSKVLDLFDDITGWIITADALHTQQAHAEYLASRGAHYCLTVKANTPTLLARLSALPWRAIPEQFTEKDTSHGREVTRSLKTCRVSLPGGIGFPHAVQAVRLTRRSRHKDATSGKKKTITETVYILTDMDETQAPPAKIAAAIRGQWTCENPVHWIRDVVYREDTHQIRRGNAPQALAAFWGEIMAVDGG